MGEALKPFEKKNTLLAEIDEHWLGKYFILVFKVLKNVS